MNLDYILKFENNFSKLSKKQLVSMLAFLLSLFLKLKKDCEEKKNKDINLKVNQPYSKKAEFEKDGKKKKKRKKQRKKNKGSGNKRKDSLIPDKTNIIPLENCPICNRDLKDSIGANTKSRIVEDIASEPQKTEVSEEICTSKWCPNCQRMVISKTEAALPGSDIGIRTTVWVAYFWVILAVTLPNITKYLTNFFKLKISCAGISRLMIRLSNILIPVYEEILYEVRAANVVYADETGWRVSGILHWIWAFANRQNAFYWPDRNRGSAVVEKTLGTFFCGTLVSDAWYAYLKIYCFEMKQTCNSHLFRKIKAFKDAYPQYYSLLKFYVKFKRIITDGEKIKNERLELGEESFNHRLLLLKNRLQNLLSWPNPNDILTKIIKMIKAQEDKILTFVLYDQVDSHNNFAEYIIRKCILKRKVSGGSMSYAGLMSYCVLISIGQTCHLQNLSFTDFLYKGLKMYIKSGRVMLLSEYKMINENINIKKVA
ncbi:MAG: IS66 family transposase [Oligoflexia bacterium]|nr:IS66 family transposase [Oligoflexia bacterium]